MLSRVLSSAFLMAAMAVPSFGVDVGGVDLPGVDLIPLNELTAGHRGVSRHDLAPYIAGLPPGCVFVLSTGRIQTGTGCSPGSRRELQAGVDLGLVNVPPTAVQIPPFAIPIGATGWYHIYAITVDYWAPDSRRHFCDFSGFVQRIGGPDPGPGPVIPWDMRVSPADPYDSIGRKCRSFIRDRQPSSDCIIGGSAYFGYPFINDDGQPDGGCGAGLETVYQPFIEGEPHFAQWNGHKFDYQGECDLVFAHAPDFGNGVGLDIHARTKIRYDYSYIETAAVRIGDDVLEVSSYGDYMLNGVSHADLEEATLAGHPITYGQPLDKKSTYDIELGGGNILKISSMKDIVSIRFVIGQTTEGTDLLFDWFTTSSGMIGSLEYDKAMMGRDGVTKISDPNAYGQEWQVRDSDPKLFQVVDRAPQYPEQCQLPSADAYKTNRRLGEDISRDDAVRACENWPEAQKEDCINDVIAMHDLEFAQAGSY